MMYRLKHYDGLINLDKFARIEKTQEEKYNIKTKRKNGTTAAECETSYIYMIQLYAVEGYGISTTLEYDNPIFRDEDYDIIVSLTTNIN